MTQRELSMPADRDGYISRECPTCIGRFKVPVSDGNATVHFCPDCGHEGENCWWTQEQVAFIQRAQAEMVRPILEDFARDFQSNSNDLIQFKAELSPAIPAVAPTENDGGHEVYAFACCGAKAKLDAARLVDTTGAPSPATCPMCGTTRA